MHARHLALILVISACGAAPRTQDLPPPPAPDLNRAVGGAYVLGCWGNHTLSAWRPLRREDWQFPEGAAPKLLATAPERAPAGCDAARTTVREAAAEVGGGRLASLTPAGLFLRKDTETLWQRATTGPLLDAAWQGDTLLAVGPHGLFRWRPGSGEPTPVSLPAELTGRPLHGIFRDGAVHWVRDADGKGWPLAVAATETRLVGQPGPLVESDPGLRVLVQGGRAEITRGAPGVRLLDVNGILTHTLDTAPVTAALSLDGGARLLIAAGDELVLHRWSPGAGLAGVTEEARWPVGAPTARLFEAGNALFAVGGYGILTLTRPAK